MSYRKTIVCLANSDKPGGHCVAGREVRPDGSIGGWIRPVSVRPTAELSYFECAYPNNATPKLLDIVGIEFKYPVPGHPQGENHLIDETKQWIKRGEFPWVNLDLVQQHPWNLWPHGQHTTQGIHDCIGATQASKIDSSLLLIWTEELTIECTTKPYNGQQTWRGEFRYRKLSHNFTVTDPIVHRCYPRLGTRVTLSNVYLCLSLTEPWKDRRCHKLIAAVISKNRD